MEFDESIDPSGELRLQIEAVVTNLEFKRNELDGQRLTYLTLKQSIVKQLNTQINEKKDEEEIMILLGDGYFAKYKPVDAMAFIDRRLSHVDQALATVDERIQEAKSASKKIELFDGLVNKGGKDEIDNNGDFDTNKDSTSGADEPKVNEEGLPFMEIREDLDEDGNVINVKINNKNVAVKEEATPEEVKEDNDVKDVEPINTSTNNGSTTGDLKEFKEAKEEDIESTKTNQESDGILSDIVERSNDFDLDLDQTEITSFVVVPKTGSQKDSISKVNVDQQPKIKVDEKVERESDFIDSSGDTDSKEDLNSLFKEMEVIGNTQLTKEDELLNKLDALDISADDKFRLKSLLLEEYRNQVKIETQDDDDDSELADTSFDSGIERRDLIELEILADDFDEIEDDKIPSFADDEEWDFEFSDEDNDDDDDDEAADELLYGKSNFISNSSVNSRLWDEVIKLRNKASESQEHENTKPQKERAIVEEIVEAEIPLLISNPSKKNGKSVRFAEKLEIFEIENISQELKNIRHTNQNLSVFMQNRLQNHGKLNQIEQVIEEAESGNVTESTIFEREVTEAQVPFVQPKKVSRFRMMQNEKRDKNSEIKPKLNNLSSKLEDKITEEDEVITDIIDREEMKDIIPEKIDDVLSETIKSNEVSSFKNEATVSKPVSLPVVSSKKKLSRFMQQRSKGVAPNVISLPMDHVSDFEPIKDRQKMLADSISEHEDNDLFEDGNKDTDNLVAMAKEYILGKYDDDLDLPGPVVNELKDFEKVNEIVEEHNRYLKLEGLEEESDEENEGDGDEEDDEKIYGEDEDENSDGEMLVDIMEREVDTPQNDALDSIIGDEITQEYHRLRRKIMQSREMGYRKSDSELEFEPIDDEGNPVKVSRFKSARLAFSK